jgi:hypothetical protein
LTRYTWAIMLFENHDEVDKMKKFLRSMKLNLGVAGELVGFLWQRKLWWLIPMVVMLLMFGLLLIFASSSGVAPFIYTLF